MANKDAAHSGPKLRQAHGHSEAAGERACVLVGGRPGEKKMRIVAIIIVTAVASWTVAESARAQSNSCKQCSDQRRLCDANYSGPTCQTEYERCMKSCGKK